jgi:CheY-like chemotaxis protein
VGGSNGTFTLLSDQPEHGTSDPLGLDRVATHLAALVLTSRGRTPFTIGIKGSWGAGKSSLMRRLEVRLREDDDVESVWFNAWSAERGNTLEGLIKSVLERLDKNVLRRAARNKNLITGARVVTTLIAAPLRLGNIVDTIWERAVVDPQARNELRKVLVEAMEEWRSKSPSDPGGRLLVVFIDDLDRCAPDTVFQVFEAIKLYLDTRGFVFVIGFDESIVSEAILEQKKYSKAITSTAYTDKIVQIEYTVPPPSDDQCQKLLDDLTGDSGTHTLLDDPSARALVVQGSGRNPRRLKRFINAFVLEHTLEPDSASLDAETLIRTLALRTYFREFVQLDGDPIAEFLDYLRVRALLMAGGDPAEEREFFTARGVDVGDLAGVERKLPEIYPVLARNEHFVELVTYLRDHDHAGARSRLQKAREEPVPVVEERPAPDVSLWGMRILWVDDNPRGVQGLVDALKAQGADVTVAADAAAAEPMLGGIDLLLSDVGRSGEEDGIDVLDRWRHDKLYAGPAIFYVARVTPERRERAVALNASITSTPGELLRAVSAFVPRPTTKSSVA